MQDVRDFFIWYSAFSFSEELTPNKARPSKQLVHIACRMLAPETRHESDEPNLRPQTQTIHGDCPKLLSIRGPIFRFLL